MRIYVIDDEPIICSGAARMIQDEFPEAEVESYTDPVLAWKRLQKAAPDVVFLDIEMPGFDGVHLAKMIKAVRPQCNIIFVTAFPEFQRDAWEMRASGYVLKPLRRERIREEISELRYDVPLGGDLQISAFGHFEVSYKGSPVHFSYSKTKELLAILVDRCGSMVSQQECIETLWGEGEIRISYFKQLRLDLFRTMEECHAEDIILRQRGYLGISRQGSRCDYFDWLDGKASGINAYRGEYMTQYPWAERTRRNIAAAAGEDL